jgi:hypothetical protein
VLHGEMGKWVRSLVVYGSHCRNASQSGGEDVSNAVRCAGVQCCGRLAMGLMWELSTSSLQVCVGVVSRPPTASSS